MDPSGGHADSSGAPSRGHGTAGGTQAGNDLGERLLPASNDPSSSQNSVIEAQAKIPTREKFKQLQIDTGNKPEELSQATDTVAEAAGDRSAANPQTATLPIVVGSQHAGPDVTNSDGKQGERPDSSDGIDRPAVPEDAHVPLADPNFKSDSPELGQIGGNNEEAAVVDYDFTTIQSAEEKKENDSSSWDNEYDARMTLRYLKPNQVLRAPVATQKSRFHTTHFADVTLVTGPARIHCYTTSADGVYPPYRCGLPSTYAGEQPAVPGPWTDLIELDLTLTTGASESKSSYPPAHSKEDKPLLKNETVTTSKADDSESAVSTFPVGSLVDHTVPIKWKRKGSRAMHVERWIPSHLESGIQHIPVDMYPEIASHHGQAKCDSSTAVKTDRSVGSSSKDVGSDGKDDNEEGWLRSESKGGDSGDDDDDFTRRGFYAGIDRRKYWARYGYRDGHGGKDEDQGQPAGIEEKEQVVEAESKSRYPGDSSEGSFSRRRHDSSK